MQPHCWRESRLRQRQLKTWDGALLCNGSRLMSGFLATNGLTSWLQRRMAIQSQPSYWTATTRLIDSSVRSSQNDIPILGSQRGGHPPWFPASSLRLRQAFSTGFGLVAHTLPCGST
ncbi:hypothetical protein ISCGN_026374 [Ixodes scapularis]